MVKDKPNFLWQIFAAVNTWVTFADAKAMGLLAADGVIGGMIFTSIDNVKEKLELHPSALWFAAIAIIMLICSFLSALLCVLPRLSFIPPRLLARLCCHKPIHHENQSNIYFGHIANMNEADYQAKVHAMLASEKDTIEQITQQIWMNSRVAAVKYRYIKWSILLLIISILFGITALFLTYCG